MRGSNAWQKMSVAKRDRRRYRLENENVDEKCRRAKNRESRSRQRQSGAAEHRAAGLTARRCDVRLTSTWFEAALLDVSGSPDLPDISMNVTECHCGFVFFIFSVKIYI